MHSLLYQAYIVSIRDVSRRRSFDSDISTRRSDNVEYLYVRRTDHFGNLSVSRIDHANAVYGGREDLIGAI